jgi:hypothetical protein
MGEDSASEVRGVFSIAYLTIVEKNFKVPGRGGLKIGIESRRRVAILDAMQIAVGSARAIAFV